MHAVFMPYGRVNWVSEFLNDVRAQKLFYKFTSPDGKEVKQIMAQVGLRQLPFGFWDISFPREYKNEVLTVLEFHKKNEERYRIPEFALKQIRKVLDVKMPGEFDTSQALPWVKGIDLNHQDVMIMPIGIREDIDIIETIGPLKGWTHEAV